MRNFFRTALLFSWFPLGLGLLWEVGSRLGAHPFFPAPSRTWHALLELSSLDWFIKTVWPTVALTLGGYGVGVTGGLVLGIFLASRPLITRALGPVAVFVRSVPSAAIIPVILALFGIGTLSLYITVTVAVLFQIALATMVGVADTPSKMIESARLMGLSRTSILFLVRVPSATSRIITGMQAALQVALLVAVTVETFASGRGIGRFTAEALDTMRITNMWVSIGILGIIGVLLHEAFHALERRLFPWYFGERKMQ